MSVVEQSITSRMRRRKLINSAFVALCVATASVSVLILIVLLTSIVTTGLKHLDLAFLTSFPSRNPEEAGLKAAIWGSIGICAVCAVVSLPLGVGTAVFLEEFKPKSRWERAIHRFVDLNIRNLAGVPSIVYGIIALTAFVQMFGVFGNLNEPAWTFGATYYDEYSLSDGEVGYLRADSRDAPAAELAAGSVVEMLTYEGASIEVGVVGDFDAFFDAEEAGTVPPVVVAGEDSYRGERRAWYYLQLPFGRGVLAGGLTLMLVILPVVIISASEALRAVPNSLREGALAAGATRWQMVWKMTLPCAVPGIMTGSILAMSRAIGEAAPILVIAGGLVFVAFTPGHLMDEFTAMPLQIYNWASRPQEEFHNVAASGIIVLLAVLFVFNAVAVIIRQLFQKPLQ